MAELVYGCIGLAGISVSEGMSLTLRQLDWMLVARERREWDRFAQLMALVDARTAFTEDIKPKSSAEYFPADLETDEERMALHRVKNPQSGEQLTGEQVLRRLGL